MFLQIAAIGLAFAFAFSARAESPREEVVHAYRLLKAANHDYAGHRIAAMGELEKAGHEMGVDIHGDLPEHEHQWKSDQQLREARRLLIHARDHLERADHERIASHVEIAVREIDAALHVR
ncbi:MAG TPA: hypothetical protein VFB72_08080 [Verrucomicrobiae bacterium]|nr:hypothetical protein [Verrucomicrobiae bacterium]